MALYNKCLLLYKSVVCFLQKHDIKIEDSLFIQKILIVHMLFHNYTKFQFQILFKSLIIVNFLTLHINPFVYNSWYPILSVVLYRR